MKVSRSINILITGTPGSGKSSLCKTLIEDYPHFRHFDISKFAIDNNCLDHEYDEEYNTHVLDEDQLLNQLDAVLNEPEQVNLLDYHSCGLFEAMPIDAIIVLTSSNEIIAERLKNRGYTGKKLRDNIEYEIFQMAVEEARDSFDDESMVHVLPNCNNEQLMDNVVYVNELIAKLKAKE